MIILLILIDFALNNLWILLGENLCWSLLGLKGLTNDFEVCICCGQQKATAILISRFLLRFPGTFGCGCMFVLLEDIFLRFCKVVSCVM